MAASEDAALRLAELRRTVKIVASAIGERKKGVAELSGAFAVRFAGAAPVGRGDMGQREMPRERGARADCQDTQIRKNPSRLLLDRLRRASSLLPDGRRARGACPVSLRNHGFLVRPRRTRCDDRAG